MQAAWDSLRDWPQRRDAGATMPHDVFLFLWGTLYAAAQVIDPTARDRGAVKRTLLAAGIIS